MANPNCCFMIIAVTFFSPANRRGAMWLVEWKEFLTKVPVCRGRRIRGMENFSGKTLPIKSQNRWAFFYFGHWKKTQVQKTNQFLVNVSELFFKVSYSVLKTYPEECSFKGGQNASTTLKLWAECLPNLSVCFHFSNFQVHAFVISFFVLVNFVFLIIKDKL